MPHIKVSDEELATIKNSLSFEKDSYQFLNMSLTRQEKKARIAAIDAARAALQAPAQEGVAPHSHLLARQALLEILGFGLDSELDDAMLMLNAKSRIARIESEIDERRTSQPAGVSGLSDETTRTIDGALSLAVRLCHEDGDMQSFESYEKAATEFTVWLERQRPGDAPPNQD